ncbi:MULTISPECIES: hypothetical protein [Helicobacter]|nr:hypothetical protein [Helicobacter sp. UBA3407]
MFSLANRRSTRLRVCKGWNGRIWHYQKMRHDDDTNKSFKVSKYRI